MGYCVLSDMVLAFGELEITQLTDRDNTGVIDSAVLDKAIADAAAFIDGYLSRYSLPLTSVPADFNRKSCEVVRLYLYANNPTDAVQKAFDTVKAYFEQVAKGSIILVGCALATDNTATDELIVMQGPESVFGRGAY
jgi:phage gp36-like protein